MTLLHQAAQKAVEALKLTISARTAPNEWDLGVFETAIEKCEVVLRQVESALQQQPEPEAPIGWLYDWTHSSALGKPDEQFTGFTTDEAHARKHDSPRAVYAAPPALQHQEVPSTAVIPPAPPECETEDEKTAFSFGYWQGLHAARKGQEVPREPVAVARPLTSEEEENAWNSITEQGCSCCTGAVRLFCRLNGITLSDAVLAASPSTTRQQEVGSGWKLVPVEPTPEMIAAYLRANYAYWKRTDELPTPPNKWRTGTPSDATAESYRAMLAAAPSTPESAEKDDAGGGKGLDHANSNLTPAAATSSLTPEQIRRKFLRGELGSTEMPAAQVWDAEDAIGGGEPTPPRGNDGGEQR